VEISTVRRHAQAAITAAHERARQRRARAGAASAAYESFLRSIAVPIARQVANALKAEGFHFSVSTPGLGLRVSSDHNREDYVEIELRTDADPPRVVGHVHRTRGSRTIDEEQDVKSGAAPEDVTEEEFLGFLLRVLEPWLER
jgi:hypothetical protein